MSKIEVKIERKGKRRRKPQRRPGLLFAQAKAALHAVLMRPRLLTAGTLIGGVLCFGTPHIAWDYQCAHRMHGIGTCEAARWCAYYGVQGRRIDRPAAGEMCTLFKLMTIDWKKLKGE
jgi:hypothetical protein